MKKFLLLSILALGGFAANAEDYTDYFSVAYEGKELTPNSTIFCKEYIEQADGSLRYEADINVISKLEYDIPLFANLVNAEGDNNGVPSLCFNTLAETSKGDTFIDSNCFPELPNVCLLYPEILPVSGQPSNFIWQAEALNVLPDATCKMVLTFYACYGDEEDYEKIDESLFTLNIVFSQNDSAVAELETENNETPIYYNLQGVRVSNPAKGLYIIRQGNKTVKSIIR